jgi:hypothetical protein
MAELKAPLAGEMSGHIFFADGYLRLRRRALRAVRLIEIVSRSRESLADMRDRLPAVVNTPELRFPCARRASSPSSTRSRSGWQAEGAEVNDIDGVRVQDGRRLVAAARLQHAGRAGRPLRGPGRGASGPPEGRGDRPAGTVRDRAAPLLIRAAVEDLRQEILRPAGSKSKLDH